MSRKSKCPRKIQQELYGLIFVSSYPRRVMRLMWSMLLHLNNDEVHKTEILSFSRGTYLTVIEQFLFLGRITK